jgi:hypothetical protein
MKNDEPLLPIRVVNYSRDFSNRKKHGGGGNKIFHLPDFREHQLSLVREIDSLEKKLDGSFKKYPYIPAVLKVDMRDDAIAKSHRPRKLFEDDTPIIGLGKIGTLYVSTTEYGLNQLKQKINKPDKEQTANITAIKNISDFDSKDRLKGLTIKQLKEKAMRKDATYLKVILFDHHDSEINQNVRDSFISWIKKMKLEIDDITKLKGLHIWKIIGSDEQQIEKISKHPSVRTLSFFPEFNVILPKELAIKQKKLNKVSPKEGKIYPKAGQIDTGISSSHPFLSPWIIDKVTYVPSAYVNNNHGSMVGSILCMAQQINGKSICPDEDNIQLIDVELIPNADPGHGPVDAITEDHLIERLKEDIPRLTSEKGIKIWY